MSAIGVNQNVYNAIKTATDDFRPMGIGGLKNINDGELKDIEKAMGADGTADTGERAVLDALKSGASFSIKSNTSSETMSIAPSNFAFPTKSKVSDAKVGNAGFVSNKDTLLNVPDSVPKQNAGGVTNINNSKSYPNQSSASKAYDTAVSRLSDPNSWVKTASVATPTKSDGGFIDESMKTGKEAMEGRQDSLQNGAFALTDASGKPVSPARPPKVGDYLKIDIPGPGPDGGKGYDWVRVESIKSEGNATTPKQSTAITVRPSAAPGSPAGTPPAHFYGSSTTNTFVVERNGTNVTAGVYGRNEVPNTDSGNSTVDIARNYGVAKGAMNGASNPQWVNLTNGLLK